ncbi:MAG: ABC transporter ATP-binding protein [Specibacter sp.]
MLTAHQLHIDGRRHTLLPATSVEAHRAQVVLIQADGQERRTALALALTGRMKPSTGTVSLGHHGSMASLRRRSAIVDAPDVNAPENHLTVRSLTSEDLALVPFKFRDRTRPTEWLVKHGFRDILEQWVEELEPARLLHLQLKLALANKDVEVVVVDSPDRHTADVSAWLPLLEQTADGEMGVDPDAAPNTPLRTLVVIGVVGRLPDEWRGPASVAGNALAAAPSDGAEPPAPADTTADAAADLDETEPEETQPEAAEAEAAVPADAGAADLGQAGTGLPTTELPAVDAAESLATTTTETPKHTTEETL